MIKKILILSTILIGLVVLVMAMPVSIKAATIGELQQMISELLAKVASLQAQLNQQQGNTTAWCHTFNTNLGMGSSGAETNALHSVLSKEVVTGDFGWSGDNFDEQTASYVVGLQEKYASEILNPSGLKHGTGYVGNSTRAKLNKLYGCGNSNNCTADAKQCPDGSYVGRTGSKCEFTACPTTKCLKEGEINSVGYNSSEQSLDCCPGLRFISVPEAWRNPDGSADSTCNPFKFTVPSSVVCTYCGNGVCGTGENSCNCPSDCKTTAVKSVSVISPNGGETFVVGQSYFIKWSAPDTTRVVIDIVGRDGKAFYGYGIPAVLSNNGLYLWQIPANEPLGDYKVRVMNCPASLSEGACANIDLTGYGYDESDNYFRIIQPNTASVKVLSPNGGESFRTGDIVNIKWQSTGIDKVNIYLCNRPLTEVGFCENITTSTGAIFGNYNWVIPADFFAKNPFFSTGNNFRIRVFNYNNDNSSDFKDESDSNFSISGDVPVCLDTDHGINFNIKGLTSGLADGNATAISTSVDYCSNQNTLIEYSCSTFLNRYQTKTTYTCPYGCEDGACINSTTITKIPRNLIAGLNAISFPLKPSNLSFQSFLAPLKDKGILAGFGYYNSSGEWVYYNRDNITGDIDINQVYFLALTANGTINFTGDPIYSVDINSSVQDKTSAIDEWLISIVNNAKPASGKTSFVAPFSFVWPFFLTGDTYSVQKEVEKLFPSYSFEWFTLDSLAGTWKKDANIFFAPGFGYTFKKTAR